MKKHLLFFSFVLFAFAVSGDAWAQPSFFIKFFVGDRMLDDKEAVPAADISGVTFRVWSDSDASGVKYEVHWRLYLRRGTHLGDPFKGTSNGLPEGMLDTAKPGDVVSLEIDHITRVGADGKREHLTLDTSHKYLSVTVKK